VSDVLVPQPGANRTRVSFPVFASRAIFQGHRGAVNSSADYSYDGTMRRNRAERSAAWHGSHRHRGALTTHARDGRTSPRMPSHSLRALVLSHRKRGAGERAVGLSQVIQDRKVIQVA
jgi:hypothetical protein